MPECRGDVCRVSGLCVCGIRVVQGGAVVCVCACVGVRGCVKIGSKGSGVGFAGM